MNLGSTSRNIDILSILVSISVILGFTNIEMFSIKNLTLTLISFYILNIFGNWMTLHRYYSHRSFEFKNKFFVWFFTGLAILAGRGSPLGWVYLHRKHHAHSDTDEDPHSPKKLGYKIFGFQHYKKQEEEPMKIFMVKDLITKEHLFIHKWYMLIILTFICSLALTDIQLLYFGWLLPAFLVHISQNNFNYFGHKVGYKNFETADNSRNNLFLFPFILGESWHNNHHADPKNFTTTKLAKELDPLAWFIKIVKK